ncbi:MAG: hypothetical protein GY910_02345 [bacterium]|nr:hypothetical protein [Deltaproteobacteria bacterium]MCP4903794.1 hypothetical protein [bacterium]
MPRARAWEKCTNQDLLEWRLCDLGLSLDGTWLESPIERLHDELRARNLRVQPHCWLSEEWFSPEGVPGIAIPFYLAHPRLKRLERAQILEVEGGTYTECLRLLRHEAGHAIQHAFRLHRRKKWREFFGSSTEPYPDYYQPNPGSRRYVVHLPHWYAQSHPDEDFAETFAVWLTPGSRWRRKFQGWPALRKLRYVDQLMHEIAGKQPPIRSRARPDPVHRLKTTLGEHYRAKRDRYHVLASRAYDQDLLRFFTPIEESTSRSPAAATFLRKHRAEIRQMVARSTGKHELALDSVLGEMIARSRELKLRAVGRQRQLVIDFAILLAARSAEFVYRGKDWHAL